MPIQSISLDRSSPGTLKDKLKEALLGQIRVGKLRAGDRLPPTRILADDLNLNRGTVSSAYDELVAEGVLSAHVGRGTYVEGLPAEKAGPNGGPFRWTDHFSDVEAVPRERELLAQASRRAGPDMISFAGLVPDESLYPVRALGQALGQVLEEEGAPLLAYGPPGGHDAFVDFLRRYLAEERGVVQGENELLVVNGSQQALDLLARAFVRPGDTVLVEEPSYFGALEIFRGYGARLVGVPVDDQGMTVSGLETTLTRERPKLIYVMPTFQNPTGSTLPASRREELVRLAARYHVPIIEDDFDGELYFDEAPPRPLKSLPGSDPVIYIGTPSKMLFPGLRIGWVAGAEPVIKRLSRIKQVSDLSGSPLLQAALARFAEAGELKKHMPVVRKAYGRRMRRLLSALEEHMPGGVTWTRPKGGLSILISLPSGIDATEILPQAIERGVMFTPGRLFFVSDGANHLRLSIGRVSEDAIEPGARRLGEVIREALARSNGVGRRERGAVLPPV
jgi:DNA-binding transcriptional MocR family regulator